MSFKTSISDLGDRWSLDRVPNVGSEMKISLKLHRNSPIHITPSLGPSETSMSSKTPGRDMEDAWSLDRVPDVDENFTEAS